MIKVALFLAGLALCASVAAADTPRLAMWITSPIGISNASQCELSRSATITPALPPEQPTLTEREVTHWNVNNAHWTLTPTRFPLHDASQKLEDHCFILAIDGKYLSSGVVLSSYSARLAKFPTLSVFKSNKTIELQLNANSHIRHSQQMYADLLDSVFGKR